MKDKGLKVDVKGFWNESSCGETYATGRSEKEYYDSHKQARYKLEPYIAKFNEGVMRDVLEIGVGMGADHIEWARSNPKTLSGIDLTPKAVEHTKKRLIVYNLKSDVKVADAENLPFKDEVFGIVYSWGVLHHSPNTPKAINEVHRVLRKGGTTRVMIYHTYSLTGYMLWLRYALLTGKVFRTLKDIYFHHLESPGTKAYTIKETKALFHEFSDVDIKIQLCFGDL